MKNRLNLLVGAMALAFASPLCAGELSQQTLSAWDQYVASAKVRMQARVASKLPFLWMDEDAAGKRRLDSGEIVISPSVNPHPLSVPYGLIHHWVGAVFIPGATIPDLAVVVRDYSRYSEIYRPSLVKAEILSSSESDRKISIVWVQRVLLTTAAFYSEIDWKQVALNERQGYMDISALRLQQIVRYGQPDERRLAPDQGNGYVWRLVTFARYEERNGGLYLELEVIALSRDFSGAARFLLGPLMDRIPKQLLLSKMEQIRKAIQAEAERRLGHREQMQESSSEIDLQIPR